MAWLKFLSDLLNVLKYMINKIYVENVFAEILTLYFLRRKNNNKDIFLRHLTSDVIIEKV